MKRDFQIAFLEQAGLRPHHRLLDIGCGTLRGGIPLIGYLDAGHYFGVEARARVLDEGRKELAAAGLDDKRPTLLVAADLSRLELDPAFDFVWAFSVLIHMSDDVLRTTFLALGRMLGDGGVFYANVNVGARREGVWQGFPVVWRSLDFYRDVARAHGLRMTDLGDLSGLGHVSGVPDQDQQRMLKFSR